MPKKKGGFDVSGDLKALNQHTQDIRRGMIREGKFAANHARDLVQAAAPEDTGAMKESMYVSTREYNGTVSSDYEPHIAQAAIMNFRLNGGMGIDAQALDPIEPSPAGVGGSKSSSVMGIPVSYAEPLIEGFYSVRAGRDIPGNDFFSGPCDEAQKAYERDSQQMLKDAARTFERRINTK